MIFLNNICIDYSFELFQFHNFITPPYFTLSFIAEFSIWLAKFWLKDTKKHQCSRKWVAIKQTIY